jgi:HEAT repeat protein
MNNQETMPLDELLSILRDDSTPVPATAIYRLSALPKEDRAALEDAWPGLTVERRRALLSRLVETSEANFEMDFSAVGELALDDPDEEVRCRAIACLWEVQTPSLMQRLIGILDNDPSTAAREEAASALGRFVLLGELGKMTRDLADRVEERLLQVCRSIHEPLDVRRRALESLSYSSREEVSGLIEDAYYHDAHSMRVSAVFSMGRSADERWTAYVLQELESDDPEMRYEAAQAAGELEIADAVPLLTDLLEVDDIELVTTAIWSLGEIGGPEARRALTETAQLSDDEDLLEAIDDALAMAALSEGMLGLIELPNDEEAE